MSIHKSLIPASKLRRHRNVLSRSERLDLLAKDGRSEGASVFGLQKVRNIMVKAKPKKKEAAADAAAPAAGAAAPAGAAAAGAKAAAPAKDAKAAAPAAKKEEKKK